MQLLCNCNAVTVWEASPWGLELNGLQRGRAFAIDTFAVSIFWVMSTNKRQKVCFCRSLTNNLYDNSMICCRHSSADEGVYHCNTITYRLNRSIIINVAKDRVWKRRNLPTINHLLLVATAIYQRSIWGGCGSNYTQQYAVIQSTTVGNV